MKITVIGTGYVGLVSGTCLADVGNDVLCLDVDVNKIRILNEGGIPIYEPGLEAMVKKNVTSGRLRFTTNVDDLVDQFHYKPATTVKDGISRFVIWYRDYFKV